MQSLWSRAAPTQSTCRCVSCVSTIANGVASRSAAAASKRRLRIGNSVTALYSTIFAAAALADAKAKDQRRNDWEEKIAAVKAEVNELVDEEKRILETLQSRRKSREFGRLTQARGFGTLSTNSRPQQRNVSKQPTRSFHTQHRLFNAALARAEESWTAEELGDLDLQEAEASELRAAMNDHLEPWVLNDSLRIKAIQKLALKQFAVRLLLRPTIAHRYLGLKKNYGTDFKIPKIDVENLLDELKSTRYRINELKTVKNVDFNDLICDYVAMRFEDVQEERRRLDEELFLDIQSFMSEQMSLQELLLRISSNLLSSVDPDRTTAFRHMLMTFTQARQNDLNELLLRTLLPHRFYLSTSLIITILSFFRKSKNLKDFDLFLQMLSGDGYSANLGAIGYFRRRRINGLDMVIPPLSSNNFVIYTELISTALRFNQPDRADAWLQAARRVGFLDNFNTLFTYIRFYSIRQDWEKGVHALKRAVTFLVSSTAHSSNLVDRLILYMVHFCDSCRRKDVSESLISAAMYSGFNPEIPSIQDEIAPLVDIGGVRWTKAAETAPKENSNRQLWQKCADFAHIFGEQLNDLEVPEDQSRTRQLTRLSAIHAQDALVAALADNSSLSKTAQKQTVVRSSEIKSDKVIHSQNGQGENMQSAEFAALKDEVSQLRQLVFELRKHHIEASFKTDLHHDLEFEDTMSQAHKPRQTSHETAFQPNESPMSVEFQRIPSPVNSDQGRRSSSPNLSFRPAAAMRAPVQADDSSFAGTNHQARSAISGQAKGLGWLAHRSKRKNPTSCAERAAREG
ncbi:hypothetical protein N7462_004693 [Penicillium macrosclerotiorum]|uniref:uncharacterized protein n=1 Tax=Penicillium macrosclerotiorum TaxID=303699 RepID=UPI0025499204|nr:uncharacterized protein N7462_004693 [Penicillium macrosclerotiorum]KAJ5690301.1 hypothetical protein N7462_004693 [Penicillium macrosclerotiorum]